MKLYNYILILTFILSANYCFSQIGFSLGIGTDKVGSVDIFYSHNQSRAYLGMGYQRNGQKNEIVNERGSNYGLTELDSGEYFWCLDLGYGYRVTEVISLSTFVSYVKINGFTNFSDERFTDGGYSLIDSKRNTIGVGFNVGYEIIEDLIELYTGYHTSKQVEFGCRVILNFERVE